MINKKHARSLLAIIAGGGLVLARHAPAGYILPVQMVLYSILVFTPPLLGLWSDRNQPGFRPGLLLAIAYHCILLYLLRGYFPIRLWIAVFIIALVEIITLFTFMVWTLGRDGDHRRKLTKGSE